MEGSFQRFHFAPGFTETSCNWATVQNRKSQGAEFAKKKKNEIATLGIEDGGGDRVFHGCVMLLWTQVEHRPVMT